MKTMKKKLILFLFLIISSLGFSEEVLSKGDYLIHTDSFMNLSIYETVDGNKLSMKELCNVISMVPDNKQIMRKEKFWRSAGSTLIGISVAALGMYVSTSLSENQDYNKIVEPASLITFGCSLLGAMVAGNISCSKRLKAVDNFNLYVMGIPIR